MSPNGGDKPDGELAAAIDEHFGSFDASRRHFAANALGVQGSGWSVLAWESLGQRPVLAQVYDHQGNMTPGMVPLLFPAGAHRRCRAEPSRARAAAARHQISLERLLYPGTQCACS